MSCSVRFVRGLSGVAALGSNIQQLLMKGPGSGVQVGLRDDRFGNNVLGQAEPFIVTCLVVLVGRPVGLDKRGAVVA